MRLLDRMRGKSRVTMLVSAAEYVAGKTYSLPVDLADKFVARGYASGAMSRVFSEDEMRALRGNPQVVTLGG